MLGLYSKGYTEKKKVFWNPPVSNYFGWIVNPQKWGFIIMKTELEQTLTALQAALYNEGWVHVILWLQGYLFTSQQSTPRFYTQCYCSSALWVFLFFFFNSFIWLFNTSSDYEAPQSQITPSGLNYYLKDHILARNVLPIYL